MKWSAQHQCGAGPACGVCVPPPRGGRSRSPRPFQALAFCSHSSRFLQASVRCWVWSRSRCLAQPVTTGARALRHGGLHLGPVPGRSAEPLPHPRARRGPGLLCLDTRPLELALLILGRGAAGLLRPAVLRPELLSGLFRDPDLFRQAAFSVYAFMIGLGGCLEATSCHRLGRQRRRPAWAPRRSASLGCALIFLTCVAATAFVAEEAALGPAEPAEGLSAPLGAALLPGPSARLALQAWAALCPRLRPLLLHAQRPAPAQRGRAVQLDGVHDVHVILHRLRGRGAVPESVPRAEPGTEARRHYS